MAAGAAAGAGAAMAEEGKTLREQRMRELEFAFRREESEKDRNFRSSEAATDREFRSGEGDKDRTFRAGESDKDRGFRRELQDDDQGFRSSESAKDRGFRAGESSADREFRRELHESDQTFRSSETDKDRTWRAGESEKERGARTGLLSNSHQFSDDQGRLWIRTPEGTKPVTDPEGNQLRDKEREFSDAAAIKGATDPMTGEFDPEKYRRIREAQRQNSPRAAGAITEKPEPVPVPEARPGGPADPAAEKPTAGKRPRIGDVVDGWRYKGGNPNDRASWESVK
jgi:hypothetical protein